MTSTNQSIFNFIKKLKLKIIIPAMVLLIILPLLLVGKANEMGYCVPEFRKLSDDELYERGMRNYMNSLVGPLRYSRRGNLPISEKNPDAAIYPDTGGGHGFYYPLWILDGKITTEDYTKKVFEYSKTDDDGQDWDRFDKTILFLNARTVLDGLSPELKVAQRNNSFGFLYYGYLRLSFMAYNCCYISDVNALKNYITPRSPYRNLYEYYQNRARIKKLFWKKYTGWREVFLILDEERTNSTQESIAGEKNRMTIHVKQTIFMPISNCGLIDHKYALYHFHDSYTGEK